MLHTRALKFILSSHEVHTALELPAMNGSAVRYVVQ